MFSDLQLEEAVQILRKRIEPEAAVTAEPPPPPISDSTPMEEDAVCLASPMSAAPLPPLPEGQKEGVQAEQQEEEKQHQDEHHEDCQEKQQQPPPPSVSEELLKPAEPPKDSKTGTQLCLQIPSLLNILIV